MRKAVRITYPDVVNVSAVAHDVLCFTVSVRYLVTHLSAHAFVLRHHTDVTHHRLASTFLHGVAFERLFMFRRLRVVTVFVC